MFYRHLILASINHLSVTYDNPGVSIYMIEETDKGVSKVKCPPKEAIGF